MADSSGTIGILDIAGFEQLQTNSFEQMIINLVNEKLQRFMNDRIFKMELEIYEAEGVPVHDIKFENNEIILELFEKVKILMAMLNFCSLLV